MIYHHHRSCTYMHTADETQVTVRYAPVVSARYITPTTPDDDEDEEDEEARGYVDFPPFVEARLANGATVRIDARLVTALADALPY